MNSVLLEGIIDTAKKAGAFIRQERENFSYTKVEVKGLNDLVSYVDKTSEKIIVDQLSLLMPEAGFIVEEKSVSGL